MDYFENGALLKPLLGGVVSIACFITSHEQTQLNLGCYLLYFGECIASKRSNYSEFVLFLLQLVLCRVTAVKSFPVYYYSADYIFWSLRVIEWILDYLIMVLCLSRH